MSRIRCPLELALVAVALSGCGGAAPAAPTDVVLAKAPLSTASAAAPPAEPSFPRGPPVDELVRQIAGARLWAIVEVSLLKGHPLADRIEPILPYARSLTRSGINPRVDFDRILLADRSLSHHHNAIAVYEHHIDSARVETFMNFAVEESDPPGHRSQVADHACAALNRRGLIGTACVVSPTLLIVAVDVDPVLLGALARSSGIPHPPAGEAVHATFMDPARSMELGPFQPPITLGPLELSIKLSPAGGLDVMTTAPSEQPAQDAAALQSMVGGQAGSLHLGPLPIPAPPIRFEAVGGNVVGSLPVTKDDLDIVLALLELTVPI